MKSYNLSVLCFAEPSLQILFRSITQQRFNISQSTHLLCELIGKFFSYFKVLSFTFFVTSVLVVVIGKNLQGWGGGLVAMITKTNDSESLIFSTAVIQRVMKFSVSYIIKFDNLKREEEKEEKTKNTRFATKIGTKVNFGTANSKIVVTSSENLHEKVKKKKKKKKRKILGSQRKLVPRSNSVRRIQKSRS